MQKMFWRKILGGILLTQLAAGAAQAQFEEGFSSVQVGAVSCNQTLPASPNVITYTSQNETTQKIRNILRFKINELATTGGTGSPMEYYPSPFTATVSVYVELWALNTSGVYSGSATTTETETLTVNYDPTPGVKYTPVSYIWLNQSLWQNNNGTGYGQVRITVNSVTVSGTTGSWTASNVLPLLTVENEMQALRYFTLSGNSTALTPAFATPIYDATNHPDQLSVSWTFPDTAYNNFSQLEYAWVENETQGYYDVGGSFSTDLLFQENSTRIDIDDSSGTFKYNIPLLFDADPATGGGVMYYRARAVQRRNDGNMIAGPWSTPATFSNNGHEPNLNWQLTTDFAENEKSKTVIQYFDGSLRPRQTVTKDNTTGNTVVAETIYDYQGRPNLQILPTPTTATAIQYFTGFNYFPDPSNPSSYNSPDYTVNPAHYFDMASPGTQCSASEALDTMYGNGMYYSGANPWIGVEKTANYIPDAAGYAYTETRYTDDPTQRVSVRGGAGLAQQIGNGHTTNYFYGKPGQNELDALFGTEAGDATHYSKNMVQDANGQMSISYVDMHDRTVATALAGGAPAQMANINTNTAFYPKASGPITDSMLTQAGNIINGDSIQSTNTVLVPANTTYNFTYTLNPAILQGTNCNNQPVCFDCKYNLEISIRQEGCADAAPIVKDYNNLQIVPANEACNTPMGFTGPGISSPTSQINFSVLLTAGSWVIRKTLSINDSAMQVREDSALNAFLCKTQTGIYDSVLAAMESATSCSVPAATQNCTACAGVLSGYTNFKTNYLASLGGIVPSDSTIHALYTQDSLDCADACGMMNPAMTTLGQLRAELLNDMVPYTGQYAIPADSISTDTALQAKYNIFVPLYGGAFGSLGLPHPYYQYPRAEPNAAGSYYMADGSDSADQSIYPGGNPGNLSILDTISADNFTTMFDRDWAEQLIIYHPEYPKLRYAEDTLSQAFSWLDGMLQTNTWAAATANGYTNPLANDPYFTYNSNTGYVPADRDSMTNYLTVKIHSAGDSSISIWELANGTALGDTTQPVAVRAAFTATMSKTGIDPSATTTAQQDAVWQAFRSLYLGYRNDMVMNWINNHESATLSGPAMAELLSEGKRLHFVTSSQEAAQDSATWWSTATNINSVDSAGLASLTSSWLSSHGYSSDPCTGQELFWQARLMQCNVLQQYLANQDHADSVTVQNIMNAILDSLVMVCHLSVNGNNPQGATNVNPADLPVTPANFENVINHVFSQYGIATIPGNNWFCNPYSIDFPKPFNGNLPMAPTYSGSVDTCNCDQFEAIKSAASAAGVDTTNRSAMNAYLQANYNDTLSQVLWTGLLKCNTNSWYDTTYYQAWQYGFDKMGHEDSTLVDSPRYLYHNIPLPAISEIPVFLGCGYVKPCISCNLIASLTDSFRLLFPAYNGVPYATGGTSVDTGMADQNALWARYLNYKTGFNNTASEYMAAFLSCGLDSSGAANLVLTNRSTQPPLPVGAGSSLVYAATTTVSFDTGYASNPGDEFQTQIAPDLTGSANAMCMLTPPLVMYMPPDTTVDPCLSVKNQAAFIAQQLFQQLQDSLIGNFDSLYRAKCLTAQRLEVFYATDTPSEYHYTLYYYDQAGNLVKTLPPDGVQPNYSPTYFAQVAAARAAGTDLTNGTNIESLATQYRYNTLDLKVAELSPDGGETHFWYDQFGRLAVSQNAKQFDSATYSYTLFDALNRITETGQKPQNTAMTQTISQDTTSLAAWLNDLTNGGTKVQITRTVYDVPYIGFSGVTFAGMNLRTRVSYSMVIDQDNTNVPPYRASTFYSYDPHGNVDTLLQDYGPGGVMGSVNNRYKLMVYNYDLISDKVNQLSYQPGQADGFYHQYSYDAENRITGVRTSQDSIEWQNDASYTYYRHGPLARVQIGDLQLQGIDYAYTLQGWLKSINPSWITPTGTTEQYDSDGISTPALFERDAYKLNLNYFDDGTYTDFTPIAPNAGYIQGNALPSSAKKNLYNGNIASLAVDIRALATTGARDVGPMIYNYGYDQLNRISSMDAWAANGNFQPGSSPLSDYAERYTYDPNGNILTLNRNGDSAHLALDQLTYKYVYAKTGGGTGEYIPGQAPTSGVAHLTNQLSSIHDAVTNSHYNADIKSQSAFNYTYDEIGELISNDSAYLSGITWNMYGKILSLSDTGNLITFTYDAAGDRISKTARGITTWYARDAQGNVLSVYTQGNSTINGGALTQSEADIFGSSRLGVLDLSVNCTGSLNLPSTGSWVRGSKIFELTNNLGNVLETISDKKIQHTSDSSTVDYYLADAINVNDYYSFGMLMPSRSNVVGSAGQYRYGFNGKEGDQEVSGVGNEIAFENRIYDPRVGRWISLDPLQDKFPGRSNYSFVNNSPILYADKDGKDEIIYFNILNQDGTKTTIRKTIPGIYHFSKYYDPSSMSTPIFREQDVIRNVTVDNRKGKLTEEEIFKHRDKFQYTETYGEIKEANMFHWMWNKYKLWNAGTEANNEQYGFIIYGKSGTGEWNEGLPKAKDGSEMLDLKEWLDFVGGLKDGAEISDLFKEGKAKDVVEKIQSIKEGADKTAELYKHLKEHYEETKRAQRRKILSQPDSAICPNCKKRQNKDHIDDNNDWPAWQYLEDTHQTDHTKEESSTSGNH